MYVFLNVPDKVGDKILQEVTLKSVFDEFFFSGNKVGVTGVEAFLISIQRQADVSSTAGKPTGLMRFSLSVSNMTKHNWWFPTRASKCILSALETCFECESVICTYLNPTL